MEYEKGIGGCYVGSVPQTYIGSSYKGLHPQELRHDLLEVLLEHPEHTQQLGFLSEDLKLTPKAITELLKGFTINRELCFGNTPEWKLNWYN